MKPLSRSDALLTSILAILGLLIPLLPPLGAQTQFVPARFGKAHIPFDLLPGWGPSPILAMLLVDTNGDRHLDLVLGTGGPGICGSWGGITVLRNTGRPLFEFTEAFAGGASGSQVIIALASGDVDGDGDEDIVAGYWEESGCHSSITSGTDLYANDGKGGFGYAGRIERTWPSGGCKSTPTHLALGDLDGDGDLDLVMTKFKTDGYGSWCGPDQDRLFLNNGKGQFTDVTFSHMPKVKDYTSSVIMGDVDGDRDFDLVFDNGKSLLNNGKARFTATATSLPGVAALVDIDGDGDLDAVGNRLYVNDGKGTFRDVTAARLPKGGGGAVGDVDGDHDPDIIGHGRVYLNNGKGFFHAGSPKRLPKGGSGLMALGDVDGDHDLDIVFGGGMLFLNDGAGTFTDASGRDSKLPTGRSESVALADVDQDGDLDVVFGNDYPLQNRLLLNDGKGEWTDVTEKQLPHDEDITTAVAFADVDRDGDMDLILGNNAWYRPGSRQDKLYLNNGKGKFKDVTAVSMPKDNDDTFSIALGDVDGDHDVDIVFGSLSRPRLYVNDGKGRFSDVSSLQLPKFGGSSNTAVALGDVDGDGDLDLVLDHGGFNALYANNGKGRFTDVTSAQFPSQHNAATEIIALGDVDGDGDLDIVFAKGIRFGENQLYLNDGMGRFTEGTSMPSNYNLTRDVALSDVDEDGDLDIVFVAERQDTLYLNDGKGSFSNATASRAYFWTAGSRAVAVGDLDGDGDPDLVFADGIDHLPSRTYLNLHRQLDAPFLAQLGLTWNLDVYSRPGYGHANAMVVPFLSWKKRRTVLPPFGTFGLATSSMVILPMAVIPAPKGKISLEFKVPNDAHLKGRILHSQALIMLSLSNPSRDWRFTSVVTDRIFRL